MSSGSADFELTLEELRIVVRFAVESAHEVLPLFEMAVPGDTRARVAVEAAYVFIDGAPRTNLQRVCATAAHRAATEAPDHISCLAAGSAGDAAAAAYLHPIARSTQVGHILRATARAALATELDTEGRFVTAEAVLDRARRRATPTLIDILNRYPPAPGGATRTARLMKSLDTALRRTDSASRERSRGAHWS